MRPIDECTDSTNALNLQSNTRRSTNVPHFQMHRINKCKYPIYKMYCIDEFVRYTSSPYQRIHTIYRCPESKFTRFSMHLIKKCTHAVYTPIHPLQRFAPHLYKCPDPPNQNMHGGYIIRVLSMNFIRMPDCPTLSPTFQNFGSN